MSSGISMSSGWEAAVEESVLPKMGDLAVIMFEGAVRDCPRDTGHLAESNYVQVDTHGKITLGNTADYAYYVEMGHFIRHGTTPRKTASHTPPGWVYPQPWLRPQVYRNYGRL